MHIREWVDQSYLYYSPGWLVNPGVNSGRTSFSSVLNSRSTCRLKTQTLHASTDRHYWSYRWCLLLGFLRSSLRPLCWTWHHKLGGPYSRGKEERPHPSPQGSRGTCPIDWIYAWRSSSTSLHPSPNSFFVTPICRSGLGYLTCYYGRILPSCHPSAGPQCAFACAKWFSNRRTHPGT